MHVIHRGLIGRRRWLSRLGLGAGAAVLAPISRRLTAEAAGATPGRRVFFMSGAMGFRRDMYTPVVRSPADFTLPEMLRPLEPHRADLLLAYPLLCQPGSPVRLGGSDDMHGPWWAIWTARDNSNCCEHTRPNGISADRLLAKHLGAGDRFPWIGQGVGASMDARMGGGWGVQLYSTEGGGQLTLGEAFPQRAFERYFGGGGPVAGGMPLEDLAAQKRSVLDFIRGDTQKLASRLAPPERAKLDQYLDSIRRLEVAITERPQAATGSDCSKPSAPAIPDTYRKGSDSCPPGVAEAHVDTMALAMACGLTHVGMFKMTTSNTIFPALTANVTDTGDRNFGLHNCQHGGSKQVVLRTGQYEMAMFARLWKALKEFPEGAGTMADSSLAIYLNDGGGSHHNGSLDHAAVILGSAGTFKTGRVVTFPSRSRTLSQLVFSILKAAGAPGDSFGEPRYFGGELAELRG